MINRNGAQYKSLKITIIYFIVGCTWIFTSDNLVPVLFTEYSKMISFSIIKGIVYVLATALLIYGMTLRAMRQTIQVQDALQKSNIRLENTFLQYQDLHDEFGKEQALLSSLINTIPDLIFYKDRDGVYLGCNSAFESFVGKPAQDIIGKTDRELFSSAVAAAFQEMDREIVHTNKQKKKEETVVYPDGTNVILETLKTPYFDPEGNVGGLIGISRDITERKNRENTIRLLSYFDTVTGVHSRAYFNEAKEEMDTTDHLPLSVIVGDVNGLKLVNDAFGHLEGDRLLKSIAEIISVCSRNGDVVARTGGDEFTVLMPNTDNLTARTVAERIRSICVTRNQDEGSLFTDIAIGYATKSDISDELNRTIKYAEDQMYRRKLLESRSQQNNILASITTTLFEKSNETEEHAERLAALSKKLGMEMNLPEDQLDELELVAMLHDLGKISIDKNILAKPGRLTESERAEIQKHPEVGYRIANATPGLRHIAEYILCHHERWDGNGYPLGLSGTAIPLIARIIAIVDAYDAMTQDRSYRKALPEETAVREILTNAATQFDPDIARLFVNNVLNAVPTS